MPAPSRKSPSATASRARLAAAAIAGLISGAAVRAEAQNNPSLAPKNPVAWEQCYGIARAGKNSCASLDDRHGCAGVATVDGDSTEWMWVPAGYCEKIVNGSKVNKRVFRARKPTKKECARIKR